MGGCCTPQRRSRRRAALLGALFFAGACNFSIAGFDAHDLADAGSGAPPGMTASPDLAMPATTPDLAIAHDLATPPTPMPDLTPLPDKIGDACADSCGGGLTCMNWVPNGYCSQSCAASDAVCPTGSTCVDISGGGGGGASARYCLVNANGGGNCTRQDLQCRDCSAKVCGPSSFCDGC